MHRLLVKGQGVFIFKTKTNFWLYNEDNTDGLYICNEYVQRVKNNEKIIDRQGGVTWFSLDAHNKYMPKSHLSLSAQRLYDCIYKTTLNTPDFTDFAKAIDHSILTPGCWCHKKLKEKASEFGKPNINETYLRITLGRNNGESPGIPYVMEIWPVNHYSPIHSHGNCDAIIHVLRGKINVELYPCLESTTPFANADFKKGEITWISPSLNQTHKLHNKGTKTCITLQCYTYTDSDVIHYDYFDYISDSGKIKQYTPDSDMDFIEFKKQMISEWNSIGLLKKILI